MAEAYLVGRKAAHFLTRNGSNVFDPDLSSMKVRRVPWVFGNGSYTNVIDWDGRKKQWAKLVTRRKHFNLYLSSRLGFAIVSEQLLEKCDGAARRDFNKISKILVETQTAKWHAKLVQFRPRWAIRRHVIWNRSKFRCIELSKLHRHITCLENGQLSEAESLLGNLVDIPCRSLEDWKKAKKQRFVSELIPSQLHLDLESLPNIICLNPGLVIVRKASFKELEADGVIDLVTAGLEIDVFASQGQEQTL